jgi:hypothetical protein
MKKMQLLHNYRVFSASAKSRLTVRDLDRFPDDSLFHRIARGVCRAGCLPRKELYEAWEVTRRVRRLFRGGRVVDLGAGHGLLAHIMLLLDDSSPQAMVIDKMLPPSSQRLHEAMVQGWPRLAGRIEFVSGAFDAVALQPTDIVVSSHACGALTDRVLELAVEARARVAVLPCCHHLGSDEVRALSGWLEGSLAIDVARAVRLEQRGYRIWTQSIRADVTPKNRLLLASPVTVE